VSFRVILLAAATLADAGCVTPPSPDTPVAPVVQVDGTDARGRQFGSTANEVLTHASLQSKVRALFGPDWALEPGHRLRAPASAFFAAGDPPRLLRTESGEYVTVTGCGPAGCRGQRALLLVRVDGEHLLARLDEGGFSHYYVYGTGLTMSPATRAFLDRARGAVGTPV
jgi:hypothetical protein